MAVTVVTLEEQMKGRLAQIGQRGIALALAYSHLSSTASYFCDLTVLPFDEAAQIQLEWLQSRRLRIGTLDKRIAAIVLSQGGVLITRNRRDFEQIPDLHLDDWSQ
ncbi:MAG: type II toxin-antitoxin system VapC family toxin [Caldilineaceae bacterium]